MAPELLLRERRPELVDAAERLEGAVALSEGLERESGKGQLNNALQDLSWERGELVGGFLELGGRGLSFELIVHPSRASMGWCRLLRCTSRPGASSLPAVRVSKRRRTRSGRERSS